MPLPPPRRKLARRAFLRLAGLAAAGELLAACNSAPLLGRLQPSATWTPTATPSHTPTPTDTSTPTPTPTATWTATPTATATPTPTPTSTPTPTPTATPTAAPTSTPTPTATPAPLRVISLIHGPSRSLVVDHVLQRFDVISTQIRVDLDEAVPDLRDYDAVVFAGGEYRPDEFEEPFFQAERERIMEALDAQVPILGICLGHQLLVHWLGGKVKEGRWEIGWLPVTINQVGKSDPLLAGLGEMFHAFLWHGDQITQLPDGATILASSEKCRVQAYRLDGLPVWGVQFNPQYDPVIAEDVIRAAKSLPKYGYDLDEMVATGYREYDDLAGRLFGNFLALALQRRDIPGAPGSPAPDLSAGSLDSD